MDEIVVAMVVNAVLHNSDEIVVVKVASVVFHNLDELAAVLVVVGVVLVVVVRHNLDVTQVANAVFHN